MKLKNNFRYCCHFFDFGLWTNWYLPFYLKSKITIKTILTKNKNDIHLGWGRKISGLRAVKSNNPFILIEDGFLRSTSISSRRDFPVSLIFDDLGIYYDASTPSRLEQLISSIEMTDCLHEDVDRAIHLIKKHHLSKYNHAPEKRFEKKISRILVIDQTFDDQSVLYGEAT